MTLNRPDGWQIDKSAGGFYSSIDLSKIEQNRKTVAHIMVTDSNFPITDEFVRHSVEVARQGQIRSIPGASISEIKRVSGRDVDGYYFSLFAKDSSSDFDAVMVVRANIHGLFLDALVQTRNGQATLDEALFMIRDARMNR